MSTRQTKAPVLEILRPSANVEKETSRNDPRSSPHLPLTAMKRAQVL